MKQKDIALILIVVIVSGSMSFFLSRMLFASPKDRKMTAEVVDVISTDFNRPSTKYFNANSIDPTQPITIGQDTNGNPFAGQ